jgi:ABC-2 type transport system ATP-binding protein
MCAAQAIETTGLTKRFGTLTALDQLSIQVEQGEVYGFLGPNGAGKTTTIRMLLGLARPSAGSARIFGVDAWADAHEAHRRLAYVAGEFNVWRTLRGDEVLDLLGSIHGGYDRKVCAELCERFEFDPSKKGQDYSKGNRQKIALIAALMVRPDLLVLDEPTGGLDPLMEVTFRHCIAEAHGRGQTVFLSSHILSEVEAVCDRVAMLRHGHLVEVSTLDDLRKLNTKEVVVEFTHGHVPDLTAVPGVEQVTVEGSTTRFRLRGAPSPLLRELATHAVTSIDIREPSLEELFLTFYGNDVDAPTGDGQASRSTEEAEAP